MARSARATVWALLGQEARARRHRRGRGLRWVGRAGTPGPTGHGGRVMRSAWAAAVALAVLTAVTVVSCSAPAGQGPLCGQALAAQSVIRHVVVVMLENRSYRQVVGNPAAGYESRLARECGNATEMFGATHGSAPNYLAVSAGQYPRSSLHGCAYAACASNQDNIYQQLDDAGLTWGQEQIADEPSSSQRPSHSYTASCSTGNILIAAMGMGRAAWVAGSDWSPARPLCRQVVAPEPAGSLDKMQNSLPSGSASVIQPPPSGRR